MNEQAQELFQPTTTFQIITKAELIIKVAKEQDLDPLQTQFFIDLITLRFPHAVESYMITWAKRIRMYQEYTYADGNLRHWMCSSDSFFNMSNQRNKDRYYQLMTIDNGLHALDENEQNEFDGLENTISWDEENKQIAETKYERQDSYSGRDSG